MDRSPRAIACAVLLVFCLVTIPPPSSGFGMLHGGHRDSGIAEILAAGLITRLLLEQNEQAYRPIFRAVFHPVMEYMMPMHHNHHAHPQPSMHHPMMSGAGIPMMHPYAAMASMHRPQYLVNQALMAQAGRQQALAARLGEEIKAQESLLEAYLARNQQQGAAESAISQLLADDEDDDVIPAAALILETAEILEDDEEESARSPARPAAVASRPEMMEMAGSEPESRYILPRIVRHFVQRLMRRAEQH